MEGECYNNDVPYINKMKLKELTKEQRASIEADELGKEIILYNECKYDIGSGTRAALNYRIENEIKRTRKRIDDEIKFNNSLFRNKTWNDASCFLRNPIVERYKKLIQQKNLYELMEQLE